MRRAKKDKNEKEKIAAEMGSKAASIEAGSIEHDPFKVEQIILLLDFPKTIDDAQKLVEFGFKKLNCLNIIEELFNREIEDETDDVEPTTQNSTPKDVLETNEGKSPDEDENKPKTPPEKLFNKMYERVTVFENTV